MISFLEAIFDTIFYILGTPSINIWIMSNAADLFTFVEYTPSFRFFRSQPSVSLILPSPVARGHCSPERCQKRR